MIPFILYLLKSTVCLIIFYLFYRLLLSGETFHALNRCTLLAMLPLSFVLPLVQMEVSDPGDITQMVWALEEVLIVPGGAAVEQTEAFDWWTLFVGIYVAGFLLFWAKHIYAMASLFRLIRQGKKEKDSEGNTLVLHGQPIAPFSWMRYIVLAERDWTESRVPILLHEQAHIRYRHSWDLIWADIFISLQWFNPAAWLVKQDLQNVHEYQADSAVLHQGIDAKTYQLLLIKKAVGTRLYSMANSFNHSTLKKRITMMIKRKSNPWARMKYLYVLPLAAMAVAAFARPEMSSATNEISNVKVSNLSAMDKADTPQNAVKADLAQNPKKVYDNTDVDQPAKYEEGEVALLRFISQNLKYPDEAVDKKLSGKTVIRFVVNEDGRVSDYSVEKSSHPILDKVALDVVKQIPQKWEPGKVKGKNVSVGFSLPVRFTIQ